MNSPEFELLFNSRVIKARNTLIQKAKEYADDVDRLHNFRLAGNFLRGNDKEALLGFLTKHLVSIRDMCLSEETYPLSVWDEKIGDSINYLILLEALVLDEQRNPDGSLPFRAI